MALNLFAASGDQAKKDVLVEFKAGCMNKDANTKWVRPDTRKGQVQLRQQADDGLIHFQWRDRSNGSLGLDLTLFPGEAVWKRVKECTTGRVYVLEFVANKKLHFFWLQEPKEDKDEENATKMNQFLKDPPPPEPAGGGAGGLDQNQLAQMLAQAGLGGLGGAGGARSAQPGVTRRAPAAAPVAQPAAPTTPASTTTTGSSTTPAPASTPAPATNTPANDNVRLALQNILSGVLQNAPAAEDKEPKGPSLNDILRSDDVLATGVLSDPAVKAELQQHLPPDEKDSVSSTIRTPQFRQAVGAFDAALAQGHINELLGPLGLQPSTQAARNNQESFLNAVQQNADKEKEKDKEKQTEQKDKMDTS